MELAVRIREGSPGSTAIALLGALGVPVLVGLVWWLVDGRHGLRGEAEEPERVLDVAAKKGFLLIVAYNAIVILIVLIVHLELADPAEPSWLSLATTISAAGVNRCLNRGNSRMEILLDLVAGVGAIWLTRHQRNGLALDSLAFLARSISGSPRPIPGMC